MLSSKIKWIRKSENGTLILFALEGTFGSLPGQFFMLKSGDFPVVSRPFSVYFEDEIKGETLFLLKPRGLLTKEALCWQKGHVLKLKGPLGNPIPVIEGANLVAGGSGYAPLHFYGSKYGYKNFYLGTATETEADFLNNLPNLKITHSPLVITKRFFQDNNEGAVIACGPTQMLKHLSEQYRNGPVYVSLEERMACGSGMCEGCAVKLRSGEIKFVCKDGPLFDGKEVDWQWLI
ncbi:hypothetical protein AT15_03090 [Kosmotoga arenicorallina S304]|uniref:Dihydroorotate dehydrogenase electron transfer subunit iron-sulphur cluster binding domain-containing protein n=1 Tax=Kosmotoga arenicorallina S304 TaxID=1453497 RepID=A0A182C7X1_9BACT|nr:hypothetical protein [Kosmotoga arenicorallina]OAA31830.1 hypothetical protein AT15_03090 [Kosmotoga arenicorallina S304]